MGKSTIGIGVLGMGVVGGGVASVLDNRREQLSALVGCAVELKGVLVRDVAKPRAHQLPAGLITTDPRQVLDNPDVDIVVELMGGQDPALEYILGSVSQARHIVTANKEVMARHGPSILTAASEKGVQVLFEAAVAAGVPIIAPLLRDLVANEIIDIHGIINGTTNYILTRMANEGADFDATLADAQELGYAEADPTNDIEGIDAAYKLAVMATLAFRTKVMDIDVYHEGITKLTSRDFLHASELGYAIKLLAIADKVGDAVQARVHPALVPQDMMLAKVDGVLNAIEVQADLTGKLLFHGAGAGSMPTTSAVVADIVDIARNVAGNSVPPSNLALSDSVTIRPISELETRYYIRLTTTDRPGVLAQVGKVLGDLNISVASAIQKETDEVAQSAELVLMTHLSSESAMQTAISQLEALDVVAEVGNVIRVEEW
ncbi:MAG: homoserine dehydrogenase [SAR202 cluster bacterium]|nr:homoserine dehydrogenase [SAR202 cluster bacterium]MDP6300462.1 homoserine dehydrogenase [SAR202 cluster bacterium]MDP7102115.1 homoserine dehydrogenase [SAR202 cluster bacterium]MDP7224094.1 homoserine dehydrogenase [SAR202 cluster bacterium]MDP7412336.1 homoserine dehydrogenase [SAR202 cluster bacterium]